MKSKTSDCLEILQRGGIYSTKELAEELGIEQTQVRFCIANIRESHRRKGIKPYVFTTPTGYTLAPLASHVIYEANLRLKNGIGNIINGIPVFDKGKKIASRQLDSLKAQYKPEMIRIGSII